MGVAPGGPSPREDHPARGEDGAWRVFTHADGEVALVGLPLALPLAELFAELPGPP